MQVIGLLRYNSFEEMFKDYDISVLADSSMTKDELINVLEQFYPKRKQKEYGVLGIRIKKYMERRNENNRFKKMTKRNI